MPQVSVIVPNYNHAKYLQKRIDSVLDQTFQDFEIIILDDCSTDNSKEIIESYRSNPSISKIIYNDKNNGNIAAQWKLGVDNSAGEYIWIAESDDFADNHFLDDQINIIRENKNCGLVYCNSYIVNEKDEIIGSMENWKNNLFKVDKWNHSYSNNGRNELFDFLIHACTINNLSSCVIKKSLVKKHFNNISDIKYTVDWILYMMLLYHSDICYNNKKLNFYREHYLNASKNSTPFSGGFIDRFLTRLTFYRSANFTIEEKRILFNKIVQEYRGILGAVRINNIKLKDFIMVHKKIRSPILFLKLIFAGLLNKMTSSTQMLKFYE